MIWKMQEGDAHALLWGMAEAFWGSAPRVLGEHSPGRKPYFPDHPERHFNLSHSGGLSLCALSDVPIGVDIEAVRPRKKGLPAYALGEKELSWFQSRGSTWEDFYTLWTLKEARVKCTGEGLRFPVRDIAVPLLEPGQEKDFEGFHFTALAGENWRGAICEACPQKKNK